MEHCFSPLLIDFCWDARLLAHFQLHYGFLDLFTSGWIIKLKLHICLVNLCQRILLPGALVAEEAFEMHWPALEDEFFVSQQGTSVRRAFWAWI